MSFTHYLVPKEDGMLLGINKFPKIDLSPQGIVSVGETTFNKWKGDALSPEEYPTFILGFLQCSKELLKIKP